MGSYECKSSFDASGDDSGTFSRVTWNVAINSNKFSSRAGVSKVGELTVNEAAEVADTLYHECPRLVSPDHPGRPLSAVFSLGDGDGEADVRLIADVRNDTVFRVTLTREVKLDSQSAMC